MALPTFQTQTFGLDTSAASVTVPLTAFTPVEGDAILVLTADDTNPDGHIVSGNNTGSYTLLFDTSSSSPSSCVAIGVQGATPDTEVTVDLIEIRAQGTTGLLVLLPGYNGIDAALQSNSTATGMPDPPALTTNTAGAVRIITGHLDDDQVDPVTAPSGFEQIAHHAIAGSAGGNTTVMVAFREEASPGTLDPGAFGGAGTDDAWATHFAVLLDAGGDTPAEVVPVGLTTTGTIGSPAVTAEANIEPAGLTSTGTIGSPAVTTEATVEPAGLVSQGTIGSPVVTAEATVEPAGLTSTGTIGTPVVSTETVVQPAGLTSTGTIGSPVVTAEANIEPAGLVSQGTIGSPAVSSAVLVEPAGLVSQGTIGSPVVTAEVTVEPAGLTAQGTIGSPVVTAEATITPIGLLSVGVIGAPVVTAPTDGAPPAARLITLPARSPRVSSTSASERIIKL